MDFVLDRKKIEIPPTPWPGSAPNKANPVERPHLTSRASEYRKQTERLRAAITPIAGLDFESWDRLPKKARIIMLDVEQWQEIIEAYRDVEEMPHLYTLGEVFQILKNFDIDVECGTCMSIAFTGYGTGEHTCQKK